MKFRKKPVTIEAITFDELAEIGRSQCVVVPPQTMPWSFEYQGQPITHENDDCYLIPTLEGTMNFNRGYMLITGVQGEIYPCKLDIFNATYEPVSHKVPPLQDSAGAYQAQGKEVLRETATNIEHIADATNEDEAKNIAAALNIAESICEPDLIAVEQERQTFAQELVSLINCHSVENRSNTPDWILGEYLIGCMKAFDLTMHLREEYYGRPSPLTGPLPVPEEKPYNPLEEFERMKRGEPFKGTAPLVADKAIPA